MIINVPPMSRKNACMVQSVEVRRITGKGKSEMVSKTSKMEYGKTKMIRKQFSDGTVEYFKMFWSKTLEKWVTVPDED